MSRARVCRFCGEEGHNSRSCRHVKFVESTLRHEIGDRVKAMTDEIITTNGTGFSNTAGGLVSINLCLRPTQSADGKLPARSSSAQYRLNQQLGETLTTKGERLTYAMAQEITRSCPIQMIDPKKGFSYTFTGFVEGEDQNGVQRAGKEVKERIENTYSTDPVKYIQKKLKEEDDNYFKSLNEKILDLYENDFTSKLNIKHQATLMLIFLNNMVSSIGRLCGNKRRTIQSSFETLLAGYRFELSKREEDTINVAPLGEKFRSKFMWVRENYTGLEVDFSDLSTEIASVLTEEQKEIIENVLMEAFTEDVSNEIRRAFLTSSHHWHTAIGDYQIRHDHLQTIIDGKLIDSLGEWFSRIRISNMLMVDTDKSSATFSAPQLSSELNEATQKRIHRYTKSLYRSNGFAKECSSIAHSGGYSQPFLDGFLKNRYAFPRLSVNTFGISDDRMSIYIDNKHGYRLGGRVSLADIICCYIDLIGNA